MSHRQLEPPLSKLLLLLSLLQSFLTTYYHTTNLIISHSILPNCNAFSSHSPLLSSSIHRDHNHHHHPSIIIKPSLGLLPRSSSALILQRHHGYYRGDGGTIIVYGSSSLYSTATVSDNDVASAEEAEAAAESASSVVPDENLDSSNANAWIIQWRGEGTEGYSEPLRQLEFTSAFRAEMMDYYLHRNTDATNDDDNNNNNHNNNNLDLNRYLEGVQFHFHDALTYRGPIHYDSTISDDDDDDDDDDNKNNGGNTNTNKNTKGSHDDEWEGSEPIPFSQAKTYESAMQYATVSLPSAGDFANDVAIAIATSAAALEDVFRSTAARCSLVRTAFRISARGSSPEELASRAVANGAFRDLMEGGGNEESTWSIRLRRYSSSEGDATGGGGGGSGSRGGDGKRASKSGKHARYGKNVRSPLRDERKAIFAMTELVELFRGKVDLAEPDCGIYLLEGLKPLKLQPPPLDGTNDVENDGAMSSRLLLARVIARGPKTSIYAPKTRICITTTPLCPIASFTLCNIARLPRRGTPSILDPFAGSCATLLAAAHITSVDDSSSANDSNGGGGGDEGSGCNSVAVEIAHEGYVNKQNIVQDFTTRSLHPPSEIIRGDCLSDEVRERARDAIGGGSFDVIVTDPPYGIREAMGSEDDDHDDDDRHEAGGASSYDSPLTKLFYAMGRDRDAGMPLLKVGGRLAAFVPVREGECLEDCLPNLEARVMAGLVMEGEGKEQVLSDILSRWLVCFVCVGGEER